MSDFDVSYDKKTKTFTVECQNVFDSIRKGCKEVLILQQLQAYVEVPLEKVPTDEKAIVEGINKKLKEVVDDDVVKEVNDLIEKLRKLQKEDKLGNDKAAAEAEKLVTDTEKYVKKWVGTFGAQVRKGIQKVYASQTKAKEQLSSSGRTNFRGMELNDDAFEGDSGKVPAFVGEFGKGLAAVGTEAFKLSNEEKDSRLGLSDAVKQLKVTLDKYVEEAVKKGGKSELDIAIWAKNNQKEVHKMEQTKDKYQEFLTEFERKLTDTKKELDKLDKLIGQEKSLKDNKDLARDIKDFEDARDIIIGTFAGKAKAASLVDRLFSDDYSRGATFVAAFRALEAQKGTTKSGKAMQDAGRAIEKSTKR